MGTLRHMDQLEPLPWNYQEPYAYLDSGVPTGRDNYTTWVVIHGLTWHAPIFRKLLPLANKSNTRIIAINQRDYPGSKPLDPEEVSLLTGQGADALGGFKSFSYNRAEEFIHFLGWLVDQSIIKPLGEEVSEDGRKVGGVAVIGWSAGNRILFSILANMARFPTEQAIKLSSYFRSLMIYDCPANAVMGYPAHSTRYSPLEDGSFTPEQRVEAFVNWVTGYFHHPSLESSRGFKEITRHDIDEIDLEYRNILPSPVSSILKMTPEELASNVDPSVAVEGKAEALLMGRDIEVGFGAASRREAFFELFKGSSDGDIWPHLRVLLIWCDMSIAEAAYAALSLEVELTEARKKGEAPRDVEIIRFPGVNHYAHWDYPKRTFDMFRECVEK